MCVTYADARHMDMFNLCFIFSFFAKIRKKANPEGLRVCRGKRTQRSEKGKGVVSADGEYRLLLLHKPDEFIFSEDVD